VSTLYGRGGGGGRGGRACGGVVGVGGGRELASLKASGVPAWGWGGASGVLDRGEE